MEKSLIEIHIKLVPDMIKDCDNSIEKVKDLTKDIEDSKAIIDQMKLQSTNEELQTQCSLIAEYIEKINKAKGEAADAFLEEKKSLEKDLRDYKTTSFVFTIYEFFGKKHFGGTEYNKFHDNLAFHLEKSEKAVQEMEKMVRAVGSIIKIIRSSAGRGL
ncbi:MAG: hypothetical protein WCT49_02950 [Candidatus Paceibacterota bacterium]|nr:hypothetical protein [Candidatus Paceibacterota bacterium]